MESFFEYGIWTASSEFSLSSRKLAMEKALWDSSVGKSYRYL